MAVTQQGYSSMVYVLINYIVCLKQTCFFKVVKQRKNSFGCALKVFLITSFGGFECIMVLYYRVKKVLDIFLTNIFERYIYIQPFEPEFANRFRA